MRATRVISLATVGRMARKAAGLALVLAALGSVANAQVPVRSTRAVPEVDPGMMASALTLMGGGLLLITSRSRRK